LNQLNNLEKRIKEFTPGTSRIEAFSDGVFAIVVTLLVLELRVPPLPDDFTSQEALEGLVALSPKFISFALSFLVIAIFWVNHHQMFHSLEKTDRSFLWYNNLLLFTLSFIPFPTAFIGEHPTSMVPVMLYGFAMLAASVSFNIMLRHAINAKLFYPSISDQTLEEGKKRGMFGPVIYFISVVAAFISVYISLAIFILVPVFYFIPQKIVRLDDK
jgi:TMEM175 potassium channel family protein